MVTADDCHSSSPATSSAAPHERHSPSVCTPPETPVMPLRLSTANRTLLIRVLNRNFAQQRQDIGSQSLSGDPLLDALPAGSPLSYPNSATARLAEQAWLASESQTPQRPDSREDRSPVTPASTLLSCPDSPTTVLLRAAASATSPPPPTPASWSEPCTPNEGAQCTPGAVGLHSSMAQSYTQASSKHVSTADACALIPCKPEQDWAR